MYFGIEIKRRMTFLENSEISSVPLNLNIPGLSSARLFLGEGNQGLEIAVLTAPRRPITNLLQKAFKDRRGDRASPVLIAVLHAEGVSFCGTSGEHPPIFHCDDASQAERLCESALRLPDRNAAIRFLTDAMPSLETKLPGVSNAGLLSLHELTHGTRSWPDWPESGERAKQILGKSKRELIEALGFRIKRLDNLTELLLADEGERTALAVLLNEDEIPELGAGRFNNLSPISYALTKADKERLDWVVMVQGDRLRLYNTKNIGVGRRGRTETYVECRPSLMATKDIGLLWLLFSSDALKEGGSINLILDNSKRFAANVADKLRDRIYDVVVPKIAIGIAEAQNMHNPSKDDLALTYEVALTVLFRLLFIAYAEDRDLLPYKGNEAYRVRSLKYKARELAKIASKSTRPSGGNHHWTETSRLWQAVSRGEKEWGVPAYNGTMFSSDASVSKVGAILDRITLPNSCFEEALRGLLLTETDEDPYAPVDFRTLSVREFGTIYEGLLESELSLTEQDLTRNNKGTYLPAGETDDVCVKAGEIYLHDRSGARKSSGSYYTPDFAVEHLLDGALEPALKEHLERMSELSEADRAEQFFNFRVADIAMGSGHFLVAAIDRIERSFALWLEEHSTPGIMLELQYLREAARKELGELADGVVIEDGQLLRRMIAKRCIYGVDSNAVTVQLARLSIWIHTFVPGLPLSLLDHNLVHGNALVGVGSLEEIHKKFAETEGTLFEVDAEKLLGKAAEPLRKLAKMSDASIKDIEEGRKLIKEAREKTRETEALCDLITAHSVAEVEHLKTYPFWDWEKKRSEVQESVALYLAREILDPLSAMHFPIVFPEVFLGRSQGFNVILSNPPWEEVTVEEDAFWIRHFPGLGGIPQREQELKKREFRTSHPDLVAEYEREVESAEITRRFLVSNYEGMGKGDPDLYKAFCWRFWHVASSHIGKVGLVLPRSVFASKGSAVFRKEVFSTAQFVDITILRNAAQWVFDIHPQYMIALTCLSKSGMENQDINVRGPFISKQKYRDGMKEDSLKFSSHEVLSWTDDGTLPLLPSNYSVDVFKQLRKAPRLDLYEESQWRARPDREMDATAQKKMMDLVSKKCPDGFWPVYKGKSFNIWEPDTGDYYAFASPEKINPWLQNKRVKAKKSKRDSAHKEFDKDHFSNLSTLPCYKPRVAFRDVTHASNSRSVIASLIPKNVYVQNAAPYLLWPRGDEKDQAFVLGVLCSIPLDWYARRFVGLHINFFVFNSFPIPRPKRNNPYWKRVVKLSCRLACPDERFADWALAVEGGGGGAIIWATIAGRQAG